MKLQPLEEDKYYHVYNRGINGEAIFSSNKNKYYFLKLLAKYLKDKVSVFAYCLLENHFHLIIKTNKNSEEVTQSFSNLFNAYAKAFNKQQERSGSLFEKHFKRIELKDENYLKQLILYVHLNPKKHFNCNFETYKISSYKSFLSKKETLLKRDYVLSLFDGIENFKYVHFYKNMALENALTLE